MAAEVEAEAVGPAFNPEGQEEDQGRQRRARDCRDPEETAANM